MATPTTTCLVHEMRLKPKHEANRSSMSALLFITFTLFCHCFSITADTLTASQSISDGQTLISEGEIFELGFFSPSSTSNKRYVGIWYKAIPEQTVVWVANRNSPLNDTSGVLKIGITGSLEIQVNQTNRVIWSSNSSRAEQKDLVLELLQIGNLVLRDAKSNIWQSFDYPTDTLLPGMKLGWDLQAGINRNLRSWRNSDDPSTGDFSYGLELQGSAQFVMRRGSVKYYRGGSWNGQQDSGSPEVQPDTRYTYEFVDNSKEVYFMYDLINRSSSILRLVLTQTGTDARTQRLTWVDRTGSWVLQVSQPRDRCDSYALCGDYGLCDIGSVNLCQCLNGFQPKSPKDWGESDWSQGCERKVALNCSKGGDGFRKFPGVKLPDTVGTWINASMTLEECRVRCLRNCSCNAYANSDVRRGGSGCILWLTDLIDMRQLSSAGQDLYVRVDASELDSGTSSGTKRRTIVIASIASVAGVIILGLGIFCIWKKGGLAGGSRTDDLELPLYDLSTITTATNNFSTENKLGEGGFGPVYKGILDGKEEIAVKRLSKDSIQGTDEFKNEVILLSKLQHKNLVRILGCCIQRQEKMLVYEYVQNNSLDSYIFDNTKGHLLDWETRFEIILGIARGLLYLHHDSRLRIIHRDLKAGNILLDHDMVPKISDFGMARIFRVDDVEVRTKRVVGTHGYMSPEYMLDGRFSVKSDVFSFGVIVLETISGKRNRGFYHSDQVNLLGHAWRLWSEKKSIELLDESMRNSYNEEDVLRCIHVGLLCVQRGFEQRPNMSSVVLMLSTENAALPVPDQPGFYVGTGASMEDISGDREPLFSSDADITLLTPR